MSAIPPRKSRSDLVTGGVSQPREERDEFPPYRRRRRIPEDNLVQLRRARHLRRPTHTQPVSSNSGPSQQANQPGAQAIW